MDERHILCDSLQQLLAEDPEQMADQSFLHTMLRMVRYGGPFVDEVREHERTWHEARLLWWVREGARLATIASVDTDGAAADVPDAASMHVGLRRRHG